MNDPQSEKPEEKKIIVDEDWKAQVEAEREAARQAEEGSSTPEAASAPPQSPPTESPTEKKPAADQPQSIPMPPASFPWLVSMLATQALAGLGQIPSPVDGKVEIHKTEAKHFIDLLAMLQEKSKGNLSLEESAMLENSLHQLRMIYVQTPD